MWLVQYTRFGFLKLPRIEGEAAQLGEELSIVTDPHRATALGHERALEFAAKLNNREGHKLWQPVSWNAAYSDWKAKNPND